MFYRKAGRGRCLQKEFRPLGLPRRARLEPTSSLPDVGTFEDQQPPFSCLFYIGGIDGRVLHVSPLFQVPGLSLDSWCIDLLHSWHYGPLSMYLTCTLRALLSTDLYKPGNAATLDKEENDKLCLLALRGELWMYYKQKRATDPEWNKRGSEAGLAAKSYGSIDYTSHTKNNVFMLVQRVFRSSYPIMFGTRNHTL